MIQALVRAKQILEETGTASPLEDFYGFIRPDVRDSADLLGLSITFVLRHSTLTNKLLGCLIESLPSDVEEILARYEELDMEDEQTDAMEIVKDLNKTVKLCKEYLR